MRRWLRNRWHRRMRAIDLDIMWPCCKREATRWGCGLDEARAAFATHAFHDPAWLALGEDEIRRQIDRME